MLDDIKTSLNILKEGGVILYPTDTIWGIGCDATNEAVVERIYNIKQRHDSKSMLILLDNEGRIKQYVDTIPDIAWELIEASETPLTIIYPGAKNLAQNLIAEDGSIGIRIAKDDFCQKLISQFGKPIVSTSANIAGNPSPGRFNDIDPSIKQSVDYIVKWKQEDIAEGQASSIIKIGLSNEVEIIRR